MRATSKIETSFALLFHVQQGQHHGAGDALALVTAHPVVRAKGRPQIGPGNALTGADESRIVSLLQGRERPASATLLPEGLLLAQPDLVAWFVPGARRPMHFRNEDGAWSTTVLWPSLVLAATHSGLFVAAHVGEGRPTLESPLFRAPVANTYDDGRVCTGNAPTPDGYTPDDVPGWNEVFFGSAFTHANAVVTPGGRTGIDSIQSFWRKRARVKRPFVARELVAMKTTLRKWLAYVERSRQ